MLIAPIPLYVPSYFEEPAYEGEIITLKYFDDPSCHGFNTFLYGERGLLVAIIFRAVKDLESEDFHIRGNAKRFFQATEPMTPFTFEWIIGHFSITPKRLRVFLREKNLL